MRETSCVFVPICCERHVYRTNGLLSRIKYRNRGIWCGPTCSSSVMRRFILKNAPKHVANRVPRVFRSSPEIAFPFPINTRDAYFLTRNTKFSGKQPFSAFPIFSPPTSSHPMGKRRHLGGGPKNIIPGWSMYYIKHM